MNPPVIFRTLILTVLCLGLSSALFAQDPNNLAVDGTIKDERGGRINGAVITLFQDGEQVKQVQTGKNGRFDLYLDFGHEFIIEISKVQYVSKKLYINTNNVPDDEQAWGYEFGGFVVDMLQRMDGVDYSILDKPIGKVYYEPNVENFVDDRVYTRQIKEEVKKLEEEQKKRIQEEEERLKQLDEDFKIAISDAKAAIADGDYLLAKDNLDAARSMKPDSPIPGQLMLDVDAKLADQGAKEERYKNLVASGDQSFDNASYNDAVGFYNQALNVKPDESYPKDQIANAQELLAAQQKAAAEEEAAAKKDREYNDLIASADRAYDAQQYQDAKTYYSRALEIKTEEYPVERITLIDQKMKEALASKEQEQQAAALEAEYADKIDKADAAFKSGNLEMAKKHYQSASEIKSSEPYPKEQLAIIETKLAELEEQKRQELARLAKREEYEELLKLGNEQINDKLYGEAEGNFKKALSLFPEEEIPQRKLELLVDLKERARLAKIQSDYQAALSKADRAFAGEQYEEAIPLYEAAKQIKPDETYPMDRINKINQILVDIANKAKQLEEDSRKRIIEETFDEGRTKVTIRRVIYQGKEDVYKRVVHSWGGKYYFLNEIPITEFVWNRETTK